MTENEWHNGNLLVGDVLEQIKKIPDESVDCCISSPPYWGLRDYGTGQWVGGNNPKCEHSSIRHKTRAERGGLTDVQAGNVGGFGDERQFTADLCPECNAKYEDPQWGLERDFRDFLAKLQLLMTEIRRILKPTGTCFINLGDTYSGGYNHSDWEGTDERFDQRMKKNKHQAQKKDHFSAKTRYGIPERFYINCIDDGWIARNHIIWAKSNAMPTSVKDRFQNKWESIFFFAKNKKYWFNLDAVREKPLSEGYRPFNRRVRDAKKLDQLDLTGAMVHAKASEKEKGNYQPNGRSNFGTGSDIKKNMEKAKYKDIGSQGAAVSLKERMATKRKDEGLEHDSCLNDPKGKNPGDIFFINPKPFVEAHFATFPTELPEKIIRCAVPEKVCKKCGVPVVNIMKPTPEYAAKLGKSWHDHENDLEQGMHQKMEKDSVTASYEKVGEKKCKCNAGFQPGVVFDPFMGSGTVARVALDNNRRWLGIEVNEEYVKIIKKRLMKVNESLDQYE
jgi:site-specific DNA-methyltransferase (cytosine-N4-specific)